MLPIVEKVTNVYSVQREGVFDHKGICLLIAPDPNAGRKHRYSVLCIDYRTGVTTCEGRELTLSTSRKIVNKIIKKVRKSWESNLEESQ